MEIVKPASFALRMQRGGIKHALRMWLLDWLVPRLDDRVHFYIVWPDGHGGPGIFNPTAQNLAEYPLDEFGRREPYRPSEADAREIA